MYTSWISGICMALQLNCMQTVCCRFHNHLFAWGGHRTSQLPRPQFSLQEPSYTLLLHPGSSLATLVSLCGGHVSPNQVTRRHRTTWHHQKVGARGAWYFPPVWLSLPGQWENACVPLVSSFDTQLRCVSSGNVCFAMVLRAVKLHSGYKLHLVIYWYMPSFTLHIRYIGQCGMPNVDTPQYL